MIYLILMAVIFLGAGKVSAANGDVVGKIYSTDILAKVNGIPIQSYNIGGKTVIIVEDLNEHDNNNYGFNVIYNDDERLLTINSTWNQSYGNADTVQRGSVGAILGNVYRTDIRVLFNGQEVTGYNIG